MPKINRVSNIKSHQELQNEACQMMHQNEGIKMMQQKKASKLRLQNEATKMKPYHPTMKWADAHFELKVPTCVEVPSQKSNKCKKIVSYGLLMPVQGRKQTNSARHGAKNANFQL